ncbi:hypothetical protein V8C35DRAFT_280150 [Trichoderma chlorosporum]
MPYKVKSFWKLGKDVLKGRPRNTRVNSSKNKSSPDQETPPSTTNTPQPSPIRLQTSESANLSLWDRAYDSLKETDGQQVEEYEKLLSRELQAVGSRKQDKPIDYPDNSDESLARTENQINSTSPQVRLAQLQAITSSGLEQLNEKKARYYIFGRKFILRDQMAQATQFIQNIKKIIDRAVKVSPQASLAWAGISVILPILMNPIVAEEVSRDGCLYITSRIQFYLKLESLIFPSDKIPASIQHTELEESLIALYRQIIGFQIRTVRRIYLTRLARFTEDAVQREDWEGLLAKIQASEKTLASDIRLVNDTAMVRELEKLNNNAEKWFADNFALAALLKDRGAPTSQVPNDSPGTWQFIATGGTQNNITGSGIHFSGVTFAAPVHFNLK